MSAWELICALYFGELVVLGKLCQVHACSSVASWDVCWPGRETSAQCTHHRNWCAHVAGALGFELASFARPVREFEPVDASAHRFQLLELN